MVQVSDDGAAVGSAGDQQGDPNFGDIRIGAVPLSAGTLAVTFLPPAANGGTDAGDIFLNSNVNWQIGSNYDLMTVMAHEFGHALGLGESSVSTAVMYGSYNGIKQALASDDITGIDSVYGTHQFDQFNDAGTRDNMYTTATNITSYIKGGQLVIPNLDITTAGDSEWFFVSVPATTTGTMSVTVQSTNLSSLSPKVQVYNSSLGLVGQAAAATASFGATISVATGVQYNQGYYIKVSAAGGPGPIGSYGLSVRFANQPAAAIAPPNTVVASQPDQGGGSILNGVIVGPTDPGNGSAGVEPHAYITVGNLTAWGESYFASPPATTPASGPAAPLTNPIVITPTSPLQPSSSVGATIVPTSAAPAPKRVRGPLALVHKKHVKHAVNDRNPRVDHHIKMKHHHHA